MVDVNSSYGNWRCGGPQMVKREKTENCLKLRWMDRLDVRLSDKRSISRNASIKLLNVSLAKCPSTRRPSLLYLHLRLPKSQNRDQLRHTKSSQKCLKIHPLPWIRSSQSTSAPLSHNIPTLSRIRVAAFEKDKRWQSMHRGPSYWVAINGMLEDHVQNTIHKIKVAMAEKEGKEPIAGWMCCSLVGDPETHVTHNFAYMEWTTAAAFVMDAFEEWQTQVSGRKEGAVQCKRRRELFNQISKGSGDVQRKIMKKLGKTKYLVINTLVTDPPFQGQGTGSELLRWATDLADKEQISIWAQAPMAICWLFEIAEVTEVEGSRLIVDIVDPNEFVIARIPERCEILFMVREARFNSEYRRAITFQRLFATDMLQNYRPTVCIMDSTSQ